MKKRNKNKKKDWGEKIRPEAPFLSHSLSLEASVPSAPTDGCQRTGGTAAAQVGCVYYSLLCSVAWVCCGGAR